MESPPVAIKSKIDRSPKALEVFSRAEIDVTLPQRNDESCLTQEVQSPLYPSFITVHCGAPTLKMQQQTAMTARNGATQNSLYRVMLSLFRSVVDYSPGGKNKVIKSLSQQRHKIYWDMGLGQAIVPHGSV